MVSKVARRIARRNQRQIRATNQDTTEKNTDPELRKTRRRGQGRPRNDNAAEQGSHRWDNHSFLYRHLIGNNDPSNDAPTANRGRGSGARGESVVIEMHSQRRRYFVGRGGRGGGRGRNRRSDEANKENQPQAKPVEEKAPGRIFLPFSARSIDCLLSQERKWQRLLLQVHKSDAEHFSQVSLFIMLTFSRWDVCECLFCQYSFSWTYGCTIFVYMFYFFVCLSETFYSFPQRFWLPFVCVLLDNKTNQLSRFIGEIWQRERILSGR